MRISPKWCPIYSFSLLLIRSWTIGNEWSPGVYLWGGTYYIPTPPPPPPPPCLHQWSNLHYVATKRILDHRFHSLGHNWLWVIQIITPFLISQARFNRLFVPLCPSNCPPHSNIIAFPQWLLSQLTGNCEIHAPWIVHQWCIVNQGVGHIPRCILPFDL